MGLERKIGFCLSTLGLGVLSVSFVTGCGIGPAATSVDNKLESLSGVVHGGQSPIQGSTVRLYHTNPSATTYGAAGILIGSATTDTNGNFTISPSASTSNCPSGSMAFITAAGGYQSGSSTLVNTSMLEMAALGDCANVNSSTNVILNEITTIAAAYALSSFITTGTDSLDSTLQAAMISAPAAASGTAAGITPTAPAGLLHAFMNAANIASSATGASSNGFSVTSNGTSYVASVPVAEVNTLANAMQACVDSQSSTTSLSSTCNTLFSSAPSLSGTTATNTLEAFVYLARNPYTNITNLTAIQTLGKATGAAFQPVLSTNPLDWSMNIVYGFGKMPVPFYLALDANDSAFSA